MIRMTLIVLIVLVLGGCLATPNKPWMFYQAYNDLDKSDPSPFFLTLGEAQEYCNRMNKQSEDKYQVGFIAR
jgi:hypothetical protein